MCIIDIHKLSNKILIQTITKVICVIYICQENCAIKLLCNKLGGSSCTYKSNVVYKLYV